MSILQISLFPEYAKILFQLSLKLSIFNYAQLNHDSKNIRKSGNNCRKIKKVYTSNM